jgi:hypothetical protein
MFEEEDQWHVDQNAEKLNRSLFGNVSLTAGAKKKAKLKTVRGLNVVMEKHPLHQKKKAKLKKKDSALQNIGIKDNGEAKNLLGKKKESDITISTCLDKSLSEKKMLVAVDSECLGDSELMKKRKKKDVVSELSQASKLGVSKTVVAHEKACTSSVEMPVVEVENSPTKKRKTYRKRKPKNKYAHLVRKKDPVDVFDPVGLGTETVVGNSEGLPRVKSKQVSKSGAASNSESISKKKRKNKSMLQNGGENSVNLELGHAKQHKNKKRKSEFGGGSHLKIAVGSPEDEDAKSTELGSAKKRKKRKLQNDESTGIPPKKQKNCNRTLEGQSGTKKRKNMTGLKVGTIDPKSDVGTSSFAKKSVATNSPFDVSELKKRLSVGGVSVGADVFKGAGKDLTASKGSQKAEVQKKEPQTLRQKMMEKLNSAR